MTSSSEAWIFGDPGRPLLGSTVIHFLLRCIPPGKVHNFPKLAIAKVDATASNLEFLALQAWQSLEGASGKGFVRRPVSLDWETNGTSLGELLLSEKTMSTLIKLGSKSSSDLRTLAQYSIAEFLAQGSTFLEVFELWQALFCWHPFVQRFKFANDELSPVAVIRRQLFLKAVRSGVSDNLMESSLEMAEEYIGVCLEAKTLDDIGARFGLSRERVRQVCDGIIKFSNARVSEVPQFLQTALCETNQGASLKAEEFVAETFSKVDQTFASWNAKTLKKIGTLFSAGDLVDGFLERAAPSKEAIQAQAKYQKAIRDAKSTIGVIRFSDIRRELGDEISNEELKRLIEGVYDDCFYSGEYAVASTGKYSGAGFFAAFKYQLAYANPLQINDAYVGLNQAATQRSARHSLPPISNCIELLRATGEFDIDDQGFLTGITREYEPNSQLAWIHKQIERSPGRVISKADLLRKALTSGQNLASVGQLLGFSPVVRGLKGGLFTIVGTKVSSSDIAFAKKVEAVSYVSNEPFEVIERHGYGALIRALYSSPFFTSGVFTLSPSFSAWLGKGSTRSISCCDKYQSDSKAKVNKEFWSGFSTLRNHLATDHGVREGDWITMQIDSASVSVVM